MPDSALYEKLTAIFRDVFDDEDLTPRPEMSADDVEDWDSLSHIRLMLSVEKTFGVRFSTVELGGLKTVGDLAALVQGKLNGAF